MRLCVRKSNTSFYCQLIDDVRHVVVAYESSAKLGLKSCNIINAGKVGESIGDKIVKLGINSVVFDRSKYLYHGKIRSFVEGVRSKGVVI